MGKDFVIECDESVFTDDEISMLKKDGKLFSKLATGLRKPENDRQKLWFKYITRCEWEKENQTDWQAYHDDKLRSLIIKSYVKTIPPSSSKEPRNRSARNLNFPKNKRSTSGKGDIPEGHRRRIDEGISGSREDFKKNKRFDG
jgi:hypothetical protein